MVLIRKTIFIKNYFKDQRFLNALRRLHVTFADTQDKNIIRSDEKIVIPGYNITEVLVPKFQAYKNYTAVECAETGKKYTYQQLGDKTWRLSKSLRKIWKLRKGDKVAVFSKNSPDYMIATIGIIRGGMVVTTLNPLYTPDEISKQLLDSEAKVIITQVSLVSRVEQTFSKIKQRIPVIAIKEHESDVIPEGCTNFEELLKVAVDLQDVDLSNHDLAALPYSSGTTGLPKGVELTHTNIVSNCFQMLHPKFSHFDTPTGNYQNILPLVLPMYHIYGFSLGTMISLATGTKVITLPKFTPDLYIKVIKNYGVTHIFAVPPLILFLINHDGVNSGYFNELKVLVNGGAPLGFSDEIKLRDKIRNESVMVGQAYGLTETSPFLSIFPKSFRNNESTGGNVGKMLPNLVAKVIATNGESENALAVGEEGELLFKGPNITRGYLNRPEETEKAFIDGWFRTGDIGYFNADGFLFITDRLKELIKVKGFQVPPAELEAVIRSHPNTEDVGVIGIPHSTQGEAPRAFIVPKNKKNFNAKQLQDYVASKVAKYKQLVGGVEIIENIPRNPSGKILRRHLKQRYLEKNV